MWRNLSQLRKTGETERKINRKETVWTFETFLPFYFQVKKTILKDKEICKLRVVAISIDNQ